VSRRRRRRHHRRLRHRRRRHRHRHRRCHRQCGRCYCHRRRHHHHCRSCRRRRHHRLIDVVITVVITIDIDDIFYQPTTCVTFDFDSIPNPPRGHPSLPLPPPPHVKSRNKLLPKSLNQDQAVPEKGKEGEPDCGDVRIGIVHDRQNGVERHLVIFWCPK